MHYLMLFIILYEYFQFESFDQRLWCIINVFQAEQQLSGNKDYAPISGIPEFCKLSIELALGDSNAHVKNNAVSKVV